MIKVLYSILYMCRWVTMSSNCLILASFRLYIYIVNYLGLSQKHIWMFPTYTIHFNRMFHYKPSSYWGIPENPMDPYGGLSLIWSIWFFDRAPGSGCWSCWGSVSWPLAPPSSMLPVLPVIPPLVRTGDIWAGTGWLCFFIFWRG